MKGLELSRSFFEEYGRQMIEDEFKDQKDRIAAGLVGHGSECFGFDDDISRDHDFSPSFCLWITDEDERRFGFHLFRAYEKLPKEYGGISPSKKSFFGSDGKGVCTIETFYKNYTGKPGAPETLYDWLYTPSFYLAEATNGEVFCDPLGKFTEIRNKILFGMPEDIRLKKLASCCFIAAQAGQYNFSRCLAHGEKGAAALALSRFAEKYIEAAFLINRRHCPYYKWALRAMKSLEKLGDCADTLDALLSNGISDGKASAEITERLCARMIKELVSEGLCPQCGDYLEPYAYKLRDRISSGELRNMPIVI